MNIRFYLFLFCCFCFFNTNAQSSSVLQKKYEHYRDRLLGKDGGVGFVSIGDQKGQSIPADGRNLISNCAEDWVMMTLCESHKGRGKMGWGDATAHQGFYIAMLALEYANFQRVGDISGMEATKRELYYAIKAVKRLDRGAEDYLGYPAKWDGFFLRDDVPIDFYKDENSPSGYRFYNNTDTIQCISSDYACLKERPTHSDSGRFISQDQVIGLFFGFSFVKKLVPDVYYKNKQETFGQMVTDQIILILDYVKQNNWKIKGPDGVKISNGWGGDFRGFNNLFELTASRLLEGERRYRGGSTRTVGWAARTSFDWAFWAQAEWNHWLILANVVNSGVWNPRKIAKRALRSDRIMFALAYSVIHDVKPHRKIKRERIQKLLASAPAKGTCFGVPGCNAPDGWKSNNCWIHAKHKNGNPYGIHMEWNGIDFMLLHNLYVYLYGVD